MRQRVACALVWLLGVGLFPGTGSGVAPSDEPGIALHFPGGDIVEVVRSVAQQTGTTFVFDERLQGRIHLTTPEPVSSAEALELLNAALRLLGYGAFPGPEGTRRILPLAELGAYAGVGEAEDPRGQAPLATLVRLRFASPDAVSKTLAPLVGASGVAVPLESSNAIVLASSEARIQRLLTLVRELDRADDRELAIFRPRYRGAEEVRSLVEQSFETTEPDQPALRLIVDERTNSLIVETSYDVMRRVREFVRELDRPVSGRGQIHVVRVRNVDPEKLAETLNRLGEGAAPQAFGEEESGLPLTTAAYSITVDPPTRSLVVVANPHTFDRLAELIAELDVPPPLVSVDAHLIEVDTSAPLEVAVDALIPLTNPSRPDDTVAFLRTLTSGSGLLDEPERLADGGLLRVAKEPNQIVDLDASGSPTVVGVVPDLIAVVAASARETTTRTLLRPQLVVAGGEEQEIVAGANVPILVERTQAADQPTEPSLTLRTNIERQDVGTRLRVRPTLGKRGGVRLELELEVSAVTESVTGAVEDVGPTILKRQIQSVVHLGDGEVAVVAARGQPTTTLVETGVPFLKDIPFLGMLFRSTRENVVRSHLVMAIQARILRSQEELLLESMRRRLAYQRSLEGLEALRRETQAPYAVLVTTRASEAEARSIADLLEVGGKPGQVVPWEWHGLPRFDVYLLGFDHYVDASAAVLELLGRGWTPEIVALPTNPDG